VAASMQVVGHEAGLDRAVAWARGTGRRRTHRRQRPSGNRLCGVVEPLGRCHGPLVISVSRRDNSSCLYAEELPVVQDTSDVMAAIAGQALRGMRGFTFPKGRVWKEGDRERIASRVSLHSAAFRRVVKEEKGRWVPKESRGGILSKVRL
jgi:hypothetical protein